MIIFKDEDNNSVMSFRGLENEFFYIELAKIGEESYASEILLEKDEVKHLISVLTKHLKTQK